MTFNRGKVDKIGRTHVVAWSLILTAPSVFEKLSSDALRLPEALEGTMNDNQGDDAKSEGERMM